MIMKSKGKTDAMSGMKGIDLVKALIDKYKADDYSKYSGDAVSFCRMVYWDFLKGVYNRYPDIVGDEMTGNEEEAIIKLQEHAYGTDITELMFYALTSGSGKRDFRFDAPAAILQKAAVSCAYLDCCGEISCMWDKELETKAKEAVLAAWI